LNWGKIQAIVLIPTSFSDSITSYNAAPNQPSQWVNATVPLYLDKGSLVATQAIPPIFQQVLGGMLNQNQPALASPIQLQTASLVEVKQSSALDFIAPGMFTFASIFLIMMVAQSFTQDRENGMMKRIRISPTTPTEFMASQVISYMSIALIQAVLVFAMTYAMGFKPAVGIPAYAFAFILVLVFSVSNVGFGLITATIAKSSSAATGIAFIFVLPQLFLGTFVGASLRRRSSCRQIHPQLIRYRRVNFTVPTGCFTWKRNSAAGFSSGSGVLYCNLSCRYRVVCEILQNLNQFFSFFYLLTC
jgi:ABC-type multidrug transport system permease subunit